MPRKINKNPARKRKNNPLVRTKNRKNSKSK